MFPKLQNTRLVAEDSKSPPYTKCYCEENVWQQCRSILDANGTVNDKNAFGAPIDSFYALFISNHDKDTLFLNHGGRAHTRWDYHVVLLSTFNNGWIWDLDSDDSRFPMTVDQYVAGTFAYLNDATRAELFEDYAPFFRAVPLRTYLKHFASDRSHMLFPVNQSDHHEAKSNAEQNADMPWTIPPAGMIFSAPPPRYPPIQSETDTMNLFKYVDMMQNVDSSIFGQVIGECEELKEWIEEQQ